MKLYNVLKRTLLIALYGIVQYMYHNIKMSENIHVYARVLSDGSNEARTILITFDMNYTISIFMPAHRYGRMKYL